jgi:dihydrolipoamide dehydrogenase
MKKIIVIGGGPAGYPAALKAASLGAQVTLIEKNALGGVCLNCGCIPSKSFLDAAHKFQLLGKIASLAGEGGAEATEKLFALRDFQKIKVRQQAATRKLTGGIGMLLKKAGVNVVTGEASFVSETQIAVKKQDGSTEILTADGVILATGTEAFFPPPFDKVKNQVYDNSTIFNMPELPRSLAIVGGGVIGCEMGDCFSALGVETHIIEMQSRILPTEDENGARAVAQALIKRGVKMHTGVSASDITRTGNLWEMTLSNDEKVTAQAVLVAIGRSANLSALHLENIGISYTRKGVQVNARTLQLKNNIYAAGDVNGLFLLAHAASRQGEVAASNLCGEPAVYDNTAIPRAIYTTPELACVGLTRAQAEKAGFTVKSHKSFLLASGRAVTQEQTDGYYELISDAQTGKLLGGIFVGANATELIHVVSVALAAQMTLAQLCEVIFAHPTLAESIGEATRK